MKAIELSHIMTRYQQATVDGSKIFYREAGPKFAPTILLLHGFPTSSHMFRNLIPALADRYHVVAPDLTGFGFSDAPVRKRFRYTFENLAKIINSFTETIGLKNYAIYVFDSSTPVVSIAKIRGRTRGIGNEFVLACDMRFASRQSALFGNPEVGVGLVPGDGALEWLPRLVGRSRALEIVHSGDDFDADIAERYGWVNRTLDDDDLDSFVDTLVRRLASFDRETLAAAKSQINRFGVPTATELQSSNDMLFPLLALPGVQARRANLRNIGYGVLSGHAKPANEGHLKTGQRE